MPLHAAGFRDRAANALLFFSILQPTVSVHRCEPSGARGACAAAIVTVAVEAPPAWTDARALRIDLRRRRALHEYATPRAAAPDRARACRLRAIRRAPALHRPRGTLRPSTPPRRDESRATSTAASRRPVRARFATTSRRGSMPRRRRPPRSTDGASSSDAARSSAATAPPRLPAHQDAQVFLPSSSHRCRASLCVCAPARASSRCWPSSPTDGGDCLSTSTTPLVVVGTFAISQYPAAAESREPERRSRSHLGATQRGGRDDDCGGLESEKGSLDATATTGALTSSKEVRASRWARGSRRRRSHVPRSTLMRASLA